MKTQLKADLMLVLVTLGWGVSYYMMDLCLAEMDPFTLNAFRFLGAFLVAGILAFPKLRTVNKVTLMYSVIVALSLVFVYTGATFGVKYTTLSNSGFLCALTVIFVPILELIVFRKTPHRKTIVAVTMSLIGIMLLTLKDDFSINGENLRGDLLCIMCAVAYAVDLLLTEKAVSHEKVDAFQLGVFQLAATGTFMLILAFIFEEPVLPKTPAVWGSAVFLAIFCTGMAFIVQAIAQQYTTASHVGIIFTLEPVFAAIVAFFAAGEVLTTKSYIGAVIMMAALFVTEIDFKTLLKKKAPAIEEQKEPIKQKE